MFAPSDFSALTLRRVWSDYKDTGRLKSTTQETYWKSLDLGVPEWLDRPITSITKDEIQAKHRSLTLRGAAFANRVMRVLKALINFAIARYELIGLANPVQRLSEVRAWNRIKKRKNIIQPAQMPAFVSAILSLNNTVARDYFLVVLFTGLRKMEAASLRWSDVDFDNRCITVRDTKNGEDHTLPMSDMLYLILRSRAARRKQQKHPGDFVFQGRIPGAHLSDWRNSQELLIKRSGVRFTIHDLRRTFITTADSLDIQKHHIKMLVNHVSSDVTDGYIIASVERLRKPMQLITDELLKQAGMCNMKTLFTIPE